MAWWKYKASKVHPWPESDRVAIGGWPAVLVLVAAVAFVACYAIEDIGEGSIYSVGGMVGAFIAGAVGLYFNGRRNESRAGRAPLRAGRTRSRG